MSESGVVLRALGLGETRKRELDHRGMIQAGWLRMFPASAGVGAASTHKERRGW